MIPQKMREQGKEKPQELGAYQEHKLGWISVERLHGEGFSSSLDGDSGLFLRGKALGISLRGSKDSSPPLQELLQGARGGTQPCLEAWSRIKAAPLLPFEESGNKGKQQMQTEQHSL